MFMLIFDASLKPNKYKRHEKLKQHNETSARDCKNFRR